MKKTIFFKIFGGYLIIIIILSALILSFSFSMMRHYHIETVANSLKNMAMVLSTQLSPMLSDNNMQRLDATVKESGQEIHTRITVIAVDGKVLADSEENPSKMENHGTRTEVAQALEGNTGRFLRTSKTLKQEMIYVAIPIVSGKKTIGVLRLSQYLKDIRTIVNQIRLKILLITFIIICISILIAFVFSRNLSKPLKELIAASERVAKKDFNTKVFLKNRGELRDLAESFNFMVSEIKLLVTELSQQKEEWDSMMLSLQEGFLILDRNEKVVFFNNSLQKMIPQNLEEGKFYWEAIREPKLSELVRDVRTTQQNCIKEIEFNNSIFSCGATFLNSQEEIAIVFHDITDMRNLEKIKTDFVQNVSHELRTPLTSIKGFIETLEDSVKDAEQKRYLDIIRRNTDRLINVINDLLLLSELEVRGAEPQYERTGLKTLIENSIKIFERQFAEKNLSLTLKIDAGTPDIKGDPFKLEQMLINLLDNAVKYTEKGGISLSLESDRATVTFTIQDTGIGIPGDHLSRIFERFYVVDKSRSKRLGGTGLGLSIVKHIVMLHNGKIDVESTPGTGTKVTVILPLDPSELP
ncbi:MAG: ATP-binding protein [Syntrophorhabdaceae bacterium]|nr:ATP-binding protein [Syntrophorhabdaceae bacterium]